VNPQINVEAWEAEVSKVLSLLKEKIAPLPEAGIVQMEIELLKVELLQTMVEQDESKRTDIF